MTFQFWALLSLACLFLLGVWWIVDAAFSWVDRRGAASRAARLKQERQVWDAIVSGRRAS